MKKIRNSRGFTLSETLIAMSLGVVVAGSATWFLVQGTRISLKTTAASTNDLAEWGILTSITVDSKVANGMVMYPQFDKTTLSDKANRLTDSSPNNLGNVLIFTSSKQSLTNSAQYDQLTGYVFDPTYKNLKKFTYIVKQTEKDNFDTPEIILKNNFDTLALVTLATNVTGSTSGKAFFCRSVSGQSGELNIQVSAGAVNGKTDSNKLIEASFFIRG